MKHTQINPRMWQNIFPLAEFGAAHSLPVTEHLPLMNADNERVSIASSIRHTTTTQRCLTRPVTTTEYRRHLHFYISTYIRGIGMGW